MPTYRDPPEFELPEKPAPIGLDDIDRVLPVADPPELREPSS